LEDGIIYSTDHIYAVLEAEDEYMKAVGIIKEDDGNRNFDDAIDLGSILSN
jgi:hypothetical protein